MNFEYRELRNIPSKKAALMFGETPANTDDMIDVEVLLDKLDQHYITARTDETAKPRRFERKGVLISRLRAPYALLRLSEHRAVAYGLV